MALALCVLGVLAAQLGTGRLSWGFVGWFRLADALLCWAYVSLLVHLSVASWRAGRPPAVPRWQLAGGLVLAAAALGLLLVRPEGPEVVPGGPTSVTASLLLKVLLGVLAVSTFVRLHGQWAEGMRVRRAPLSPPAMVVGSFALAILLGWILLSLPEATPGGKSLHPVDALFTSTSAVCVTGLIVKDTPRDLSSFGHVVVLGLIQIGGLGIMTLSALFGALLGRRFSVRERLLVRDTLTGPDSGGGFRLGSVVGFVLVAEAIGAFLLWIHWSGTGIPLGQAGWLAAFHAVSAFCNAGFSLFTDSLMSWSGDAAVNLTVMGLILVGGLGFPVVLWLAESVRRRIRHQRLRPSLHARLVLATTVVLLLVGTLFFALSEGRGVLESRPVGESILISAFQATTPRTAGFNTVDLAGLREATVLVLLLLMFVGASPGSTGGGIKTSTLALLILTTWTTARGEREPSVGRRRLPEAARHRAFAVFALMLSAALFFTLALSLTQSAPLLHCAFEAVSALGTVGLSLGLTPHLTYAGRVMIIVAMFLGRVGPLTLALAVGESRRRRLLRYPEEDVMVG